MVWAGSEKLVVWVPETICAGRTVMDHADFMGLFTDNLSGDGNGNLLALFKNFACSTGAEPAEDHWQSKVLVIMIALVH